MGVFPGLGIILALTAPVDVMLCAQHGAETFSVVLITPPRDPVPVGTRKWVQVMKECKNMWSDTDKSASCQTVAYGTSVVVLVVDSMISHRTQCVLETSGPSFGAKASSRFQSVSSVWHEEMGPGDEGVQEHVVRH